MRRILGIILVVVGIALGVSWFVHRQKIRALNSGDVVVREQPSDSPKPPSPPSPAASLPTAPTQPAAQASSPQPPAAQASAAQPHPAAKLPAPNSLPRNPPNGMIFAGSGKYQVYRQGDITWRLNTDTGWACVLLATDEQWSKPRVYQEGCRSEKQDATRN